MSERDAPALTAAAEAVGIRVLAIGTINGPEAAARSSAALDDTAITLTCTDPAVAQRSRPKEEPAS
ncbi:hypothetical protein [Streptomyces graminofaciens]|uniref:hypothetical protein n=1 Tax=Streptomyces graminofaciens TaxID=68212 RepID=UPI00257257DE|nr:hypothetical protein [Streptomyces graminofaciens]